jgi:hypothetical protein
MFSKKSYSNFLTSIYFLLAQKYMQVHKIEL